MSSYDRAAVVRLILNVYDRLEAVAYQLETNQTTPRKAARELRRIIRRPLRAARVRAEFIGVDEALPRESPAFRDILESLQTNETEDD